jgi:hypothetical protein
MSPRQRQRLKAWRFPALVGSRGQGRRVAELVVCIRENPQVGMTAVSVIDLNTAVEILVSASINEAGTLVGLSAEEIADANRPGVKRRGRNYLAKIFDEGSMLTMPRVLGVAGSTMDT